MANYRENRSNTNGGRIRNHTMTNNYSSGHTYTSGNTVRKIQPAHTPPVRQPVKRTKKVKYVRPKQKTDQGVMTGTYAIFLFTVSVVMLLVCYQYLSVSSMVASKASEATQLQKNVSNLKMDNDAKLGIVNQTVNMESVKVRAVELGMTFMANEQIINYQAAAEDIMIQYNEIPSNGVVAQYERAYE